MDRVNDADRFESWIAALEQRHLAERSLPEVRRGLQALSARYVERRGTLRGGGALDGAGKRAAFALYYAPLHHLVVRHVVRGVGAAQPPPRRLYDLGCGSGAAGAAWALAATPRSRLIGVDRSGWALDEARWNWRRLGLRGSVRRGNLLDVDSAANGDGLLLAYAVNELDAPTRATLRDRLERSARRGARILVVEPIARRVAPWWEAWCSPLQSLPGARVDEWRLSIELPQVLRTLARGAGLRGDELTARSLWVP